MAAIPSGASLKYSQTTPLADVNKQIAAIMYGPTPFMGGSSVEKDRSVSLGEIESPAVILVINNKTSAVQFVTNKFFLQSIQKPKMERFQIVETFRDSKLFFFGERTKVYTIAGMLLESENQATLNTSDQGSLNAAAQKISEGSGTKISTSTSEGFGADLYKWSTGLQDFYNKHLRGTKLAEQDNVAILSLEGFLIHGYPIQLQIAQDSNNPHIVQFQMTWAILKEERIGVTDPTATYRLGQTTSQDATAYKKLAAELKVFLKRYNDADAAWALAEKNRQTANKNWADLSEDAKIAVEADLVNAEVKRMEAYNNYISKAQAMIK